MNTLVSDVVCIKLHGKLKLFLLYPLGRVAGVFYEWMLFGRSPPPWNMTMVWCVSCDNLHGDSTVFGPNTFPTYHPFSSIFSSIHTDNWKPQIFMEEPWPVTATMNNLLYDSMYPYHQKTASTITTSRWTKQLVSLTCIGVVLLSPLGLLCMWSCFAPSFQLKKWENSPLPDDRPLYLLQEINYMIIWHVASNTSWMWWFSDVRRLHYWW